MTKKAFTLTFVFLAFLTVHAIGSDFKVTELINTPTAHAVDYGDFHLSFRLYNEGSVINRLQYGIIVENLALGLGVDAENIVGNGDVEIRRPALYVKIPVYSGDDVWPALSVGYDEQGYGGYTDEDKYKYPPMGFFASATRYGILAGLNFNFGLNSTQGMSSAYDRKTRGFAGLDYMIGPEVMAMAEVEDIPSSSAMLNAGFKYLMHTDLSFQLLFIDVLGGAELNRSLRVFYEGEF
ncbi:MAG: hypothetical protein ACQESB_00565 [Elusimicrobiota bacterium]